MEATPTGSQRVAACAFAVLVSLGISGAGGASGAQPSLPACEWCGAQDAPPRSQLSHIMRIAGPNEEGRRIVLRGVVYEADGRTPAAGVLLYAYHTDATGHYRREGGERGNGRRHGVLRGWLVTDERGRYEIHTIKPAPYPRRTEPAHVHVTLTPRGGEERWVESFLSEGDPLISEAQRRRSAQEGRFGWVVRLKRDDAGVLVGERNLRLHG